MTQQELKEKIALRFPKALWQGEEDIYQIRMNKLLEDINQHVEEVIGNAESNKKTYDPFYHDELLEMQRKRAEEQ